MNINTETSKIDLACENFKKVNKSGIEKFNTLDNWLEKESNLFLKETKSNKVTYKKYMTGQLIKVDFGINIGAELSFIHYAIVITKNDSIYSDCITVIPLTSKKGKNRLLLGKLLNNVYPTPSNCKLDSYANLSQIKTISKNRIPLNQNKCICDKSVLNKIDDNLIKMFTYQK